MQCSRITHYIHFCAGDHDFKGIVVMFLIIHLFRSFNLLHGTKMRNPFILKYKFIFLTTAINIRHKHQKTKQSEEKLFNSHLNWGQVLIFFLIKRIKTHWNTNKWLCCMHNVQSSLFVCILYFNMHFIVLNNAFLKSTS